MSINSSPVVDDFPNDGSFILAIPTAEVDEFGNRKVVIHRVPTTALLTRQELDGRLGDIDAALAAVLGPDT